MINVSLEKRSVLSSSTSNLIFGMKEDGIVVLYLAAAAAGWQHFTFLTWQKLSCLDTSCSHDGIPSVHTVTNIFQNWWLEIACRRPTRGRKLCLAHRETWKEAVFSSH